MLRITARLRARARTMPVRSPRSRVMPALSIATSVPVPIAMPMSAAASAGASLTPSPAMATTRPLRRRSSTTALFWSGRTSAAISVMPRRRASERVFAQKLDARCEAKHLVLVEPRRGNDGDDFRLAFGERPGLVDHERVDPLHALERFGVLDQHAGPRAAADADHDRHRGREP